jgi:hypothetical protein
VQRINFTFRGQSFEQKKSAMTLYGIETKLSFPPYRFHVTFDSGAEVGLDQRDVEWREQDQCGRWSEPLWVRSFYFEDCDQQHIRNFCKKFAQDQAYRSACVRGTTDWSQRDRLFVRNIAPPFWQASAVIRTLGDPQQAYAFFKQHWKAIITHPSYQQILAADSTFQPSSTIVDPEIQAAVQLFNTVPAVRTKFSCQGVSGTVCYANLDILVVTPHERFGYIWFDTIPPATEQQLIHYLTASSGAEYQQSVKQLVSTGNNRVFRATAYYLAQQLLQKV